MRESICKFGSRRAVTIAALLLALASAPVFAQNGQDIAAPATPVAPKAGAQSKLATHTQIVANNDELAMLSAGSEQALADAIAMYKLIVKNGGWPEITSKKLSKGAKGE